MGTAQVWSSELLLRTFEQFKAFIASNHNRFLYHIHCLFHWPITISQTCSELTLHIEWGFVCCDEMFRCAFSFKLGVLGLSGSLSSLRSLTPLLLYPNSHSGCSPKGTHLMKCYLSCHWLHPERKRLLAWLNYLQWPLICWKNTGTYSVLSSYNSDMWLIIGWPTLSGVWSLVTSHTLVAGCRLGPCWLCVFGEWLRSPI